MSNVLNFQAPQLRRRASLPVARACAAVSDAASPPAEWHAKSIEQIKHSVLMLDLAAQHAHVMARQISDQDVRRNLIGQIEIIESLLQLARDMSLKL